MQMKTQTAWQHWLCGKRFRQKPKKKREYLCQAYFEPLFALVLYSVIQICTKNRRIWAEPMPLRPYWKCGMEYFIPHTCILFTLRFPTLRRCAQAQQLRRRLPLFYVLWNLSMPLPPTNNHTNGYWNKSPIKTKMKMTRLIYGPTRLCCYVSRQCTRKREVRVIYYN